MKLIYLVYCIGNYVEGEEAREVYTTRERAEKRAEELQLSDTNPYMCFYHVLEMGLDVTEEEYLQYKYQEEKSNGS